jgi:hypothetical protein
MHLVNDWAKVLKKAWSVRFAILAAVLSAAEIAVQLLAATRPTPYFAMAAGLASLAASVARIVAQPKAFERE